MFSYSVYNMRRGQAEELISGTVETVCPDCWLGGCGLNGVFGVCADGLEIITPFVEALSSAIWCFGSPLAFPFIFLFPSDPHTNETSGYDISMLRAPLRRPLSCCLSTICFPCGQWYVRRKVLGGDMTKYKLWQGYHDGPQCCARRCPGAFITIESGTYGEQDCPNMFLCLEVWVLGGLCSTCCAFDVSRRYQREERGLNVDPTEARQDRCIDFFSHIMHACFQAGLCCCLTSCCMAVCAPDSEGAQECAGEAGRASRACCQIARTLWIGIEFTRVIGMGCMTAQMIHEAESPWDGGKKGKDPPVSIKMERGEETDNYYPPDGKETKNGGK